VNADCLNQEVKYVESRAGYYEELQVLEHFKEQGNVAKTCRHFGIARQTYYDWKVRYGKSGDEGLINNKPCPENLGLRVAPEIQEKIVYLRTTYHLGSDRICWFTQRYHPHMKVS
jgi:hypothetical protein